MTGDNQTEGVMITPKEAGKVLREYFETVSDDEFREDMRRSNPHLFTGDTEESGSVGVMSDMDAMKAALREMDWTEDDEKRCLSVLARATEAGKQWLERATTAEQQARHYQERALSAERVLDCGHPAACWNGRACQWCIDKECCEGNLWVLGKIKRIEERARIAEAELLDLRTKSTALYNVMDRQIDEADEVAKRAEERVETARAAFEAILHNGMFAEIYGIAKEALAALHEHEHAAQATLASSDKEEVQSE